MIELMLQAERALSMGLVEQAEHLYWQAVESDGRNVIAIVGLAKVALARGDDRTALQFARKALELDPEDGAAARLVERLEDLARLRTDTNPATSAPTDVPAAEADTQGPTPGASSDRPAAEVPAADLPAADLPAADPSPVTAPASIVDPPPTRSKADIEWPATDVLGAAPIPPRTLLRRPVASGDAAVPTPVLPVAPAPKAPPPEPVWPAVLPASPPLPQRPLPQRPPPPPKKRGLLDRFRKNG